MPIHNLHSDWMDLALSHASCSARHWALKVPWRRRRGAPQSSPPPWLLLLSLHMPAGAHKQLGSQAFLLGLVWHGLTEASERRETGGTNAASSPVGTAQPPNRPDREAIPYRKRHGRAPTTLLRGESAAEEENLKRMKAPATAEGQTAVNIHDFAAAASPVRGSAAAAAGPPASHGRARIVPTAMNTNTTNTTTATNITSPGSRHASSKPRGGASTTSSGGVAATISTTSPISKASRESRASRENGSKASRKSGGGQRGSKAGSRGSRGSKNSSKGSSSGKPGGRSSSKSASTPRVISAAAPRPSALRARPPRNLRTSDRLLALARRPRAAHPDDAPPRARQPHPRLRRGQRPRARRRPRPRPGSAGPRRRRQRGWRVGRRSGCRDCPAQGLPHVCVPTTYSGSEMMPLLCDASPARHNILDAHAGSPFSPLIATSSVAAVAMAAAAASGGDDDHPFHPHHLLQAQQQQQQTKGSRRRSSGGGGSGGGATTSIRDPRVVPTLVIYDEDLTGSGTPERFSAPSGIAARARVDAFADAHRSSGDDDETAEWSYLHLPGV
ncbi:hypothetical protein ACCO45_008628 [Purpureocillium lilacinum]|uniref:Uncharacterized protein n=1 Tax=Purpureocillium lilacinum TaxID=33203 RepID=A0ACC4DNT0_PURLI